MIYAIPARGDNIDNHWMRAEEIAVVDSMTMQITRLPLAKNGEATCKSKSALLAALKEFDVSRVYVRNIGQCALGKLLKANIEVMQLDSKTNITNATSAQGKLLTEAEQGRVPPKHQGKSGHSCSGHSCSGHHHAPSLAPATQTKSGKIKGFLPF